MARTLFVATCSLFALTAMGACGSRPDTEGDDSSPGLNVGTGIGSNVGTGSNNSGSTNSGSTNPGSTSSGTNSMGTGTGSTGTNNGSSFGTGSTGTGSGTTGSGTTPGNTSMGDAGAGGADDMGEGGADASGTGAGGSHVGGAGRSGSAGSTSSNGGGTHSAGGSGPGTAGSATTGSTSGGLVREAAPTSQSASTRGSFEVKTYTAGLVDSPDIGTQTMHYPSNVDGPFAGVVVVPGFTAPESSIKTWGPFLASHGIVTLTIGTNTGGESPDVRAQALIEGVAAIKAENTRTGSPLQGKIESDRFAIMGWSMGGGGTLIASNDHPELKAALPLAAWDPGAKFTKDQVPTLLFAGGSDPIAGGQSQGFYDSIPMTTPKMLFEVAGGGHDVANNPSGAKNEVGRYGLAFLKVFLEGDERYRQFLLQDPTQDSSFKRSL